MGNVVLPFDHMKPCHVLAELTGLAPDSIYKMIFTGGVEADFETGVLAGDGFLRRCEELLGRSFCPEEFRIIWSDIFAEDDSVSRVIRDLKPSTRLILLSNTNPWHFQHVKLAFPIISEFDSYVLSYQVGALKPSCEIFKEAIKQVDGCESVVYIDDIAEYTEAAAKLGLRSHLFTNGIALRRFLEYKNFL